jgi:CP family cyanate transporter-like MFS transporter
MTTERPGTTTRPVSRRPALAPSGLLIVAIVLVAANLRPAVTGLGPVLDQVRDSLHTTPAFLSVLTALPGLCFGLAGFLAPVLAGRHGLGRALAVALALLTAGLAGRALDGPGVMLTGTFVACAGIAICNVLLPVVIRESFPGRIGVLTGLYTAVLQGSAALASVLTPVLDAALRDWRAALASWAGLAALALVGWLIAARSGPERVVDQPAVAAPRPPRALLRSGLAWSVTLFFGLQALFAYSMMGWLPQVLMSAGVGRDTAGLMLGVMSVLGVPMSLVVTPLASRARAQSGWLIATSGIGALGIAGLIVAPAAAPWLWTVLAGLGMGVFALAVALITLRTGSVEHTRALSTMAQGTGYLLAAVGPLVFGVLHGLTGGWTVPLLVVLAATVLQCVVGAFAGRPRVI